MLCGPHVNAPHTCLKLKAADEAPVLVTANLMWTAVKVR